MYDGRFDPGLLLDGEVIHSPSLLVDGCHSTDHILAVQWAFVSLGQVCYLRATHSSALSTHTFVVTLGFTIKNT